MSTPTPITAPETDPLLHSDPHTTDPFTPHPDFDRLEKERQELHSGGQRHESVVGAHEPSHDVAAGTGSGKEESVKRVVVIAVDNSKNSNTAFNWCVENFLRRQTDLAVLVNVRPNPMVPGPFGTAYMDYTGKSHCPARQHHALDDIQPSNLISIPPLAYLDYLTQIDEKNRHEAHTLLHHYLGILHKNQAQYTPCSQYRIEDLCIHAKAIAMRGDARDEICRKVEEVKADCLALGSRGQGAWRRTFLGSVSGKFRPSYKLHFVEAASVVPDARRGAMMFPRIDHCIHHVKCPVIIIKDSDPYKSASAASQTSPQDQDAPAAESGEVPVQLMPSSIIH
ncbi:hypothetical protein HDV00_009790 [Rhizophlyctis rosea]|nr:hypothetical protein HDV00_009790 [Rhizophlyctis rosea]